MFALTIFGPAIIAILLIRFVGQSLGTHFGQSHLITYCWTFAVAFVTGPLGLTVAVHYFGAASFQSKPVLQLFSEMLAWGFGPALVCVYISYYLDRQTWRDLPDIDHSYSTLAWRLLNCLGFAIVTVFLLLPPLLSIQAQPERTGMQPSCASSPRERCSSWLSGWPWPRNSRSGRGRKPPVPFSRPR